MGKKCFLFAEPFCSPPCSLSEVAAITHLPSYITLSPWVLTSLARAGKPWVLCAVYKNDSSHQDVRTGQPMLSRRARAATMPLLCLIRAALVPLLCLRRAALVPLLSLLDAALVPLD